MRIVVLSDSHKKVKILKQALDYAKKIKADLVLHAGDIVKLEGLEALKDSKMKYIAVFGNNDDELRKYKDKFNVFDEPYYFEFNKIKFKIMHKPKYLKSDADIIIFGHTHDFEAFKAKGSFYLNSGELCARDNGKYEFAYFDVKKDKYLLYRVYKKDKEDEFSKQEIKIKEIKE